MEGCSIQFAEKGYAVIPELVDAAELETIVRFVDELVHDGVATRRLIEFPGVVSLQNV